MIYRSRLNFRETKFFFAQQMWWRLMINFGKFQILSRATECHRYGPGFKRCSI